MTTPVSRVTDLTRRFRLDIDTGTFPAVAYNQLMGIYDAKLIEERRTQDDEVFEDLGAMREEISGYSWRIEVKIRLSLNLAGTSRDAVHAFLRSKWVALRTSTVAANEFGARWYDRSGLAGEASEGRVYVKSWSPESDKASTDTVTLVLQGQGALAEITNPAASQVPVVTSVSPTGGAAAGGDHTVSINGNHFTGATGVAFGATAATSYTVVSDALIVAIPPAHAAGTVQVAVTTAAGTSADTAADDYLYA